MGIRSQNNPAASYLDKWVITGYDAAVAPAPTNGHTASGGVINDYTSPTGEVYRAHIFQSSGTFDVTTVSVA